MGRIAVAASFAVFMLGSVAAAQEEEGGGELDSLMSGDPEQPAKQEADGEDAEQASDDEKPEGASEGDMSMGDDERPPGDESDVQATPFKEAAEEGEAEDHGHPNPVSVGLLAGYGLSTASGPNAWTFGFGLRAGYNISAFYLGGRFVYYVGETKTELRYGPTGDMRMDELTANLWEFGAEAGYDIDLGSVALRPGLGFGFASVNSGTVEQAETEANLFVAPGLSLFYEVSDTVYLGFDGRYQAVLATETVSGIVMLANVGMRF